MQCIFTKMVLFVAAFALVPGFAQAQDDGCRIVNYDCQQAHSCASFEDCQFWTSDNAYRCCVLPDKL